MEQTAGVLNKRTWEILGPEGSCRTSASGPGSQRSGLLRVTRRSYPPGDAGWRDGHLGTGRGGRGKGHGSGPWRRPVSRVWERQKDWEEQKTRAVSAKCWLIEDEEERFRCQNQTQLHEITQQIFKAEIPACKVISKILDIISDLNFLRSPRCFVGCI